MVTWLQPLVSGRAAVGRSASPASDDIDPVLRRRLEMQERRSIRLAGLGQAIVASAFALMFAVTSSWPIAAHPVFFAACFAGLGLLRLVFVQPRRGGIFFVYPIVAVEAVLLAAAILYPNPFSAEPWPRQAVLRLDNDIFFLFLVAVSAFSYRASVVLWTALVSAIAWAGAVLIVFNLPDTVTGASLGGSLGPLRALDNFLQPTFFAIDLRIKEVLAILLLGGLLATAVLRARSVATRELAAQHRRHHVERMFGRFLPWSVAQELVEREGALAPVTREATILFVDIESFSQLVGKHRPAEVFAILSDFFDHAGRTVNAHGGAVLRFVGDAMLAVFNLPSPSPGFASQALSAARGILVLTEQETFAATPLHVRIGIATGPVMAGLVGRDGRLEYTIHGEAVNLAARLQALSKEHGTRLLACDQTVAALGLDHKLKPVGSIAVRGLDRPVTAFADV